MSIWLRYSQKQRDEYIQFLKVYGALSNLFRQKQGDMIPYLDSKFQETIFSRVFQAQMVDVGNTPHDVLAVFGDSRVGIGLKTWMHTKGSYQKVMQLKRYKNIIDKTLEGDNWEKIALCISQIKNERMLGDYSRLGLSKDGNIYHYITRDKGKFVIQECSYPLVDMKNLGGFDRTETAFHWSDGIKKYKYTFGDSQIFQYFGQEVEDTVEVDSFEIDIIENPFEFLLESYKNINFMYSKSENKINFVHTDIQEKFVEVFLPLYSYRSKEVEKKSGLNAWNAAPKSKMNPSERPSREIYIPIPRDFHIKHPDFFVKDIFAFEKHQKAYKGPKTEKPEIRFDIILPNGKEIPGLVTQSGMKGLQSGSLTKKDENGKLFGQAALGDWLLDEVLHLSEREIVTKQWLEQRGTDSIRLWRKVDDYTKIYMDFAPLGSFEEFMTGVNPYVISGDTEGD